MRRDLIAGLTASLFLNSCSTAGVTPEAAGSLAVLLSNVNTTLQGQESTLNGAASDRVNQISNKILALLKQAGKYGKQFNLATSDQRSQFVSDGTVLLQQASALTDQVGGEVSDNVNKVLVGSAATMQAIPFTREMKPFVLGSTPISTIDTKKPIQVRAYVFIPRDYDADSFAVEINGVQLKADNFADDKIGFTIPADVLIPDQVNTYQIVFTKKKRLFGSAEPIRINGDIQADDPTPWKCVATVSVRNPGASAQLTGTPVDTYADSNHSTVSRDYSAKELFGLMHLDGQKYDADSAKILSAPGVVASASKPCSCGNDPSGHISTQTENDVAVDLSAPSTGYGKVCGHGLFHKYICGGGGSNITYRLTPVLGVKIKGVARTLPAESVSFTVARKSETTISFIHQDWRQIAVSCNYVNGPLTFAEHAFLKKKSDANISANHRLKMTQDGSGVHLATLF